MSNPLYAKALIAEHAYTEELERLFGKDACNARYDRKRNESTPELKRLAQEWHALCEQLIKQVTA